MTTRPRSHPEEESLAELAATKVGPRTARVMSWLFVFLIVSVPLSQTVFEIRRGQTPRVFSLFTPLQEGASKLVAGEWRQAASKAQPLVTSQYLHSYEEDLEKTSIAHRLLQPRVQSVLTGSGKFGNEKCLVGRSGWLFYQPGLDYVIGPDILNEERLRMRAKKLRDAEGADPEPDPRPAILQMNEDCQRAGVHLVVLPVPDKATLQAAQLTRRVGESGKLPVVNNPGYRHLVDQLRADGVDVFDMAPESVDFFEQRYLRQDTHWTPGYMEETATRLADHIRQMVALPKVEPMKSWVVEKDVSRPGDLVDMLRLPRSQARFLPERVIIRQVVDANRNRLWAPDPDADVVLLGDSFTNIYSDGEGKSGLGWGRAAGFAPHLSRHLERHVDVIARNGSGAVLVRSELARRQDPLGGKRVVVWEFAARDLAFCDWKPIPLKVRGVQSPSESEDRPEDTGPLVVTATIVAVSRVPRPFTVPYKDCLTYAKVHIDGVEQGQYGDTHLIAAFWGMKDNVLQAGAQYRPGDRFRLTLTPLMQTSQKLQTVRTADDLNDYEHPTYYVEQEQGL